MLSASDNNAWSRHVFARPGALGLLWKGRATPQGSFGSPHSLRRVVARYSPDPSPFTPSHSITGMIDMRPSVLRNSILLAVAFEFSDRPVNREKADSDIPLRHLWRRAAMDSVLRSRLIPTVDPATAWPSPKVESRLPVEVIARYSPAGSHGPAAVGSGASMPCRREGTWTIRHLTKVGITCALCHSSVDDSFAPGIGRRLDGWANTDLNVGTIVALSPALDDATKAEVRTWGPGKYDPRHHAFDGASIIPLNSPSVPIVIPI